MTGVNQHELDALNNYQRGRVREGCTPGSTRVGRNSKPIGGEQPIMLLFLKLLGTREMASVSLNWIRFGLFRQRETPATEHPCSAEDSFEHSNVFHLTAGRRWPNKWGNSF